MNFGEFVLAEWGRRIVYPGSYRLGWIGLRDSSVEFERMCWRVTLTF